ncbi:site-2 protease family protein [Deinococcus sp. HMF7620]|uniref:Site-2 protease family protein n=1 Tax=Deinococcus arboris TaxID=2682977 RepID=A0A7C9HZ63_9DEIO|nr:MULTISPECIES: site-2 protease family protein [Deinococcus]MBZ9751348.1 site-2 protease family protein [Deinococcus betulae]MVN86695.1 site-2 protease family protein [Deinococcus arboris]
MGLLSLLSENPLAFVVVALALVLSLAFHEFAHAWAADRLGDPTPRRYGRVTLNPIKHLDPFGTLLLLFVGFGFARPVPINPNNLGRWGTLWVSAAGPLSNVLIAVVCAVLLKLLPLTSLTLLILMTVLSINIVLAVFNLIPIPLLDGSRILGALVPSLGRSLAQFEAQPFSFVLVMVFIFLFSGQIGGIIRTVQGWVVGLIGI